MKNRSNDFWTSVIFLDFHVSSVASNTILSDRKIHLRWKYKKSGNISISLTRTEIKNKRKLKLQNYKSFDLFKQHYSKGNLLTTYLSRSIEISRKEQ